ncbi:hypothetical protein [Acinetobacter schindleri]|uniref:hypothetical protein n=1 Tax=Acinetobacter schindleri TaxID=108981 RepID=UPI0013B089FE|nr:hypothetical protein [Acinetobacter schindleri]NYB17907.1 hypothetical protein [Acinetobacter baumannii]QIC65670.1 hypothetical protein FSC11_15030 [Acinetobacter schindleri]
MKKILFINILTFILTSLSLFYQRYIPVNRIVVDKLEEVNRLAGGFPFVFLIDGDSTSPGNHISALFIFWDLDEFLLKYFILDYLFWLSFILVCYLYFKKRKNRA